MERPLRISALLILVGLVVELLTLFSGRPTAFLFFAGIACLLIAAGILFYLVTLLRNLIPKSGNPAA